MRIDLITYEDWAEFKKRYPDAYAFLENASLISEREDLRREQAERLINGWKAQRLEELDQWYQSVHGVKKEEV